MKIEISGVCVSPGSAETLVRGGGKINRDLIAFSLCYGFAKKLSKSVNGHKNYSVLMTLSFFHRFSVF